MDMNKTAPVILFLFLFTPLSLCSQQNIPTDSVRHWMVAYRFQEAIQAIDRLLVLDSLNEELLRMKAEAYQSVFQFRKATMALEKVYSLDTMQQRSLIDLVDILRQTGQYPRAVAYCEKLVSFWPEIQYFDLQLANLYYLDETFDRAIRQYRKILLGDTANLYVIRQLANALSASGQTDSAIVYYQLTLRADSLDAGTVSRLANQYIIKKRYRDALVVTERFLASDSLNADIVKQNAYCKFLLHEYSSAILGFLRCAELGDRSHFTARYLGQSYYRTEAFDLAEPWFRTAYLADSMNTEICFYYGVSATRALNPDTGLIMLTKAWKALSTAEQFLTTVGVQLAETYNRLNQPDTALWFLKRAYANDTSDVKILFRIGYQYDLELNDPSNAMLLYEQYLSRLPVPEKTDTASFVPGTRSFEDFAKNRLRELRETRGKEIGDIGNVTQMP